jgi:hypothetical protein
MKYRDWFLFFNHSCKCDGRIKMSASKLRSPADSEKEGERDEYTGEDTTIGGICEIGTI